MTFIVYILFSSSKNKYYIGYTADAMEERLRKHNSNHKGFTGNVNDWQVKYYEKYQTKTETLKREKEIKEVYNAHSEFELKDLLELKYKYSENYLDTLFNNTFKIEVSKKEIYRMVFGVEYDESDFHKRPFSKFKKDMLKEIGIKI